jgi:hypothetical protein
MPQKALVAFFATRSISVVLPEEGQKRLHEKQKKKPDELTEK